MKKLLTRIIIFYISLIPLAYSSSSLYMSNITGRHFLRINELNGNDAEPYAREACEKHSGIGNCELIYKTDYGGYGAIAIGNKTQGYAKGAKNQKLADKVSMEACKEDSTPSTCHITSRWHDEGKKIPRYKYIWVPDDDNYCGTNSATGLAINCNTGMDSNGNANGWNNGIATGLNGSIDARFGK